MPASGSSIFTHADGYQASLRDLLSLVVLRPREFRSRLTWVEFSDLKLFYFQEDAARIAYVTLPSDVVFIIFPTERSTVLTCGGIELRFGQIMFHAPGEHLHQRTDAASRWAAISLTPASLMSFGRTIIGRDLVPPRAARVLNPARADLRAFHRLHAQVGRIAERTPGRITHPEIARALEQDLTVTLMRCIAKNTDNEERPVGLRQAAIMVQFEAILAGHPRRPLKTSDVCDAINISERTLRICCREVLRMSPGRYRRLRRLTLLRAALMHTNPVAADGEELVKQHGFPSLHQFVAEYWITFGEMPPIPARVGGIR